MGQHQALQVVQESLQPAETLMAFLDDVCVLSNPNKISEKAQWNANSGTMPGFRSTTERRKSGTGQGSGQPIATICSSWQTVNPTKCGGRTPHCRSTNRVSPFWEFFWEHPAFVEAELSEKVADHATLLERIPQMQDLQCAWLLLLFCATSRANYLLRVVLPEQSFHFAVRHDAGISWCHEQLLHIPVSDEVWQMAILQFSWGGLGLRNAERLRPTAYWASWADTLPVVRGRHQGLQTI